MKLSTRQAEVIKLMKEGWSLAYTRYLGRYCPSHAWLQFGKVGHGGKSKDVHMATFDSLAGMQMITRAGKISHTTEVYELTEKAKNL